MDFNKTLKEYLNDLSSNSPTPGGGNVAALCGALSASLGVMVCNLTIGKKKYADVETEMISIKQNLEKFREKFLDLAAKDNKAFDKVMQAIKLPKESDTQKTIRLKAIEEATIGAAEVPLEVIKYCNELLPILRTIADKGNKNSLSDAGVAVALANASAFSANLNVLINCSSLSNQTIADEIRKRTEIIVEEISRESSYISQQIVKSILPG